MKTLNIGDKVDFVNDYGVMFENKTIIEINDSEDEVKYYFEPTDTPWMHTYAKNLHPIGTYKPECIKLQAGSATFKGCDFWGREIFQIEWTGNNLTAALVDGKMHSYNSDYDEPGFPLISQLQPIKEF